MNRVRLWYLATPYTDYPHGRVAAYIMACLLTARLMREGVPVFSPIAHSHGIAQHGQLDGGHEFWVRVDAPMVSVCGGLIAVKMDGWGRSRGMAHEINEFHRQNKPVVWWDPTDDVPQALLPDKQETTKS